MSGNLTPEQLSACNIFQVGLLIARAALLRRESRGSHLREDYALTDDLNFARHLEVSKECFEWEESRAVLYR
jgi:L-aspartate oxidase